MNVLITDADDRKALASVRNLGRLGIRVIAAGTRRFDQALYSKYTTLQVIYPNPVKDADGFVDCLLDFVKREPIDCILPMSDYTTIPLSLHRDEFLKYTHLAVPPCDVLEVVRNKPEIARIASSLGIGIPETHCPSSLDEAREVAARVSYPCVVKFKKGTGAIGIHYPRTPQELLRYYENTDRRSDVVFDDLVPMVQEYIPGGIHDVCVLFDRGRCVAAEIHQRTKMYPPTGGYGAAYETELAPDMRDLALRLLTHVGWHGPALVEFKRDSRDGLPKLMEVNTRFWGGVDVSAHAGIDFVHMAYRLATEGSVTPAWDYQVGMKYRWPFPTELKSALLSADRFEAILDFLTLERGTKYDLVPSDPVPHLVHAAYGLYRTFRSLFPASPKTS